MAMENKRKEQNNFRERKRVQKLNSRWVKNFNLKSYFKISILSIKVMNFKPFESQLKDWESQSNGFYPPEQDPL